MLLIVFAVFAAAHLIVVVVSNNVAICHGILCGTFRSYEAAATAHTIFRIPYSVEVRLSVSFTLLLLFNGITKGEGERVSGGERSRGHARLLRKQHVASEFSVSILICALKGEVQRGRTRRAARGTRRLINATRLQ